MFKFIRQYAEHIDHAQVYPMISLMIFFVFFVLLIWYVIKMDKENVAALSEIPLDKTDIESISN
jgi:Ca2+/Na+ antiporter